MAFNSIFGHVKSAILGLSAIQSNAVLRERITFIGEQMDVMREAHARTEKELAEAKAKIVDLEKQVAANSAKEEFVEHMGAAFRKDASGSYSREVYCPKCLVRISAPFPVFAFHCTKCGWDTEFTGKDLSHVMSSLP
ncbi:hypothetical protein K5Z09_004834 [Escherichia coli]|nr:hypothetical protein [Escherichia coli]EHR9096862.1 hypothetical protein [Escherichia coli]EIM2919118.1 hypothetical protein [Escherichia coli]EIM2934345.1 hypothetical protein [Escherichia coli]EIM2938983.1 hypothetical protein [Escherichia coli]